jgi:hypothetical protein
VAPEHATQALLGREFLEGEGSDGVALLSVGMAKHEARCQQGQMGCLGQLAQGLHRRAHERMRRTAPVQEVIGMNGGDERRPGARGDLRHPPEQLACGGVGSNW